MLEQRAPYPFKNPEWKERKKELRGDNRGRVKRNVKQIVANDALSNKPFHYLSMEAPVSLKPAKKYCDITGFQSKYKDNLTELIFCDRTVSSYIKMLSRPVVEQFLSIRKPLPDKPLI